MWGISAGPGQRHGRARIRDEDLDGDPPDKQPPPDEEGAEDEDDSERHAGRPQAAGDEVLDAGTVEIDPVEDALQPRLPDWRRIAGGRSWRRVHGLGKLDRNRDLFNQIGDDLAGAAAGILRLGCKDHAVGDDVRRDGLDELRRHEIVTLENGHGL